MSKCFLVITDVGQLDLGCVFLLPPSLALGNSMILSCHDKVTQLEASNGLSTPLDVGPTQSMNLTVSSSTTLSSAFESSKAVGHRHKGTGLAWSNGYDAGQCTKLGLFVLLFSFSFFLVRSFVRSFVSFVFFLYVLFAQVMMNDEVQVFIFIFSKGPPRSSVEYAAVFDFERVFSRILFCLH